jgi:TonB family protein
VAQGSKANSSKGTVPNKSQGVASKAGAANKSAPTKTTGTAKQSQKVQGSKNLYKGSVTETERLKGTNPSGNSGLSRIDLDGNDFSSDDDGQTFNSGKSFSGEVSSVKPKPKPLQGAATKYTTKTTKVIDPDATLGLDLEWDTWHKELAEEVFARFDEQAQIMFRNSPPLAVQVAYVVNNNGTVSNIRVLKPSKNPAFDSLVVEVVRSISGDFDLLEFPLGSRRKTVEKISTFTQNFGAEGYRSTTGDREKIQGN